MLAPFRRFAFTHPLAAAALLAALAGCDEECPDGSTPFRGQRLVCDEESRACRTETYEACPCPEDDPRCNVPGMCEAIDGLGELEDQGDLPTAPVIDGTFTGDEWAGVTPLEGLYTDVYLAYRGGRLYFLNDWKVNEEGIEEGCHNYFQVRVGEDFLELRVYGNGTVTLTRNGTPVPDVADGAYGFGPSPTSATDHTIFEFSIPVEPLPIDICCFDPVTESACEMLTAEPMVVSLRFEGGTPQVGRTFVNATLPRGAENDACGPGIGRCIEGLECRGETGAARCLRMPTDAGVPDEDGGPETDAGPVP